MTCGLPVAAVRRTASASLSVLVPDLVLDLLLRGRLASRRVENEDEKSRDGFPKIRGHAPVAGVR